MAVFLRRIENFRVFKSQFLPTLSWSMNYASEGGSGSGGSIREAGGAFAKQGKAREEEYFRKLQADQVSKLKSEMESEISYHEEQLKHHEDAIRRHRERLDGMIKDHK